MGAPIETRRRTNKNRLNEIICRHAYLEIQIQFYNLLLLYINRVRYRTVCDNYLG